MERDRGGRERGNEKVGGREGGRVRREVGKAGERERSG